MRQIVRVMLLSWAVVLTLSLVALAAEDVVAPIIDRLPEEILIFGASGGAIVSLLLSVLKYFRIVGQHGYIPTQAANFLLSVAVAAVYYTLQGQPVWAAVLTAFASMVAASGLHETVGHAAKSVVGNR